MPLREGPTATDSGIALRSADFATLAEALDYAATGDSGFNFYDGRGALTARLPYRDLRDRALELAKRLAPLGRGQRLALVADTHPDFAVMLLRLPVRRPGARAPARCRPPRRPRGLYPPSCASSCATAKRSLPSRPAGFHRLPARSRRRPAAVALRHHGRFHGAEPAAELPAAAFVRGARLPAVHLGQHALPARHHDHPGAVMANLEAIFNHGFQLDADDRCCLLAAALPRHGPGRHRARPHGHAALGRLPPTARLRDAPAPVADADLAATAATISFSPPFGYALCARRVTRGTSRRSTCPPGALPASAPSMIHAECCERFAERSRPPASAASSFLPCYGMAECSLAVSFAPLERGACSRLDRRRSPVAREAWPARRPTTRARPRLRPLRRAAARLRGRGARRTGAGPCPSAIVGRI